MLIENVSRRSFLTAAGGLAIGFFLPLARRGATAETPAGVASVPEINAWVVIRPDDTVIIRIARSEMGQGTLTGLAQLVAEELECDWSKVTTEYPTPGRESGAKSNLGRLPDGRLARYPHLSRICSQGWRGRTADAGRGCRQGMVRATIGDLRGQKRAKA